MQPAWGWSRQVDMVVTLFNGHLRCRNVMFAVLLLLSTFNITVEINTCCVTSSPTIDP